jgi:hypothetical protein
LGFLAKRFQAATDSLERLTRWSRAKALGVPLNVDLAGEDWVEPNLLPEAPTPPPIPPAAFFKGRTATPGEEEDWGAAISAAKANTPAPVPAEVPADEWGAALEAAKRGATPAPELTAAAAPAPQPAARPSQTAIKVVEPAARSSQTLKVVQPAARSSQTAIKAAQPTARTPEPMVKPRISESRVAVSLKSTTPLATGSDMGGAKSPASSVDPHVAAATRKVIAAALRT